MEREAQIKAIHELIENEKIPFQLESKQFYLDLSEALYTCNERSVFGDTNVSSDDAIRIWKLVESIRKHGFPDELKM
jgi:hypothetical protein